MTPLNLAAQMLRAIQSRNAIDTADLDEVVLGCSTPIGEQGAVLARTALLMADYCETVSGLHVSRFCASGLDAVNIAAAKVMSGEADFTIGGGVESMSRVPLGSDGGAWMTDPSAAFQTYFVPQGISADLLATKYHYAREALDAFAATSHAKAVAAWDEGRFKNSIVPVCDQLGRVVLEVDETIRRETNAAQIGKLEPSFASIGEADPGFDTLALMKYPEVERIIHSHHAGNSSAIVDGAAAIMIGNDIIAKKYQLRPRARFVGCASIGSEPTMMLTGPVTVTSKLLNRLGLTPDDIDIFEVNEAFASVVLHFADSLHIPMEKINPNGGAIAMGHPLGATGAILVGTALDELERTGGSKALITLCVGAGMGVATVIERV